MYKFNVFMKFTKIKKLVKFAGVLQYRHGWSIGQEGLSADCPIIRTIAKFAVLKWSFHSQSSLTPHAYSSIIITLRK